MSAATTRVSPLKRAALLGITGVLALTLGACTGKDSTPEETATPSASATPTESAEPDDSGDNGEPSNEEFGISLADVERTDAYGTYRQIQVEDASPLLQYDDSIVDPATLNTYTPEQIAAAQKWITQFYVSEGVDSILVFDASADAKARWLDENTAKFAEQYQADVFATVENATAKGGYGFLEGNAGDWRAEYDMRPYEYSNGNARVVFDDLKITKISVAETGDLRFDFDSTYFRRLYTGDEARLETTTNTQSYSVAQVNGEWKITGWQNQFNNDWTELLETAPSE